MPSTWIFQANPTRFDIQGYLSAQPVESEWLVSRHYKDIAPGDRVFLWRSGGDKTQPAGIIAEGAVLSEVRDVIDDGPAEFWTNPAERMVVKPRARISLGRIANKREVIKRDWWKEDPVLRNHLIMKMANHTTFRLEGPELTRLDHLWARTGSDWLYEDSVAGLFAFIKTRGTSVSRLPGSPVAEVALIIGRPIAGVYNKVMNFRSLDPQDTRAGLDGASDQDRFVWAQFFNAGVLHAEEVEAEFERLWVLPAGPVDARAAREEYDVQTDQLSRDLSLAALWERYLQINANGKGKPRVRQGTTKVYARDPIVGAIARKRANFACEVSGCTIPLFLDAEGQPFLEVHHIQTLANGGADTPDNVACLCPTHHREAHHGAEAYKLIAELKHLRAVELGQE